MLVNTEPAVFKIFGTPLKLGKKWHSGTFLRSKTYSKIKKKYLKKNKKKKIF
jgi:hypothetical protein